MASTLPSRLSPVATVATVATVAAAGAAVLLLGSGAAFAKGGGGGSTSPASGAWPAAYPLPTSPGTVVAQSSARATVRSTDTVGDVVAKLDSAYAALGCSRTVAVNKPRDYFCRTSTGKTDEVSFTFAALDPTAADPSRSQTNAFLARG